MFDMDGSPQEELPLAGDEGESAEVKRLFAARLNKICDDAGIPPKHKNRQAIVGKRFSVSQKAARKWLEGEGLPTLTKSIEIATSFGVYVEWLLTGRGPEKVPKETPPDLDGDIVDLARRIQSMPDANRKLLMHIFSSPVQDNDPRLGSWDARAARKSASRLVGKRRW